MLFLIVGGVYKLLQIRNQHVVNTGQYESEWSIENSKRCFCSGLRYLFMFYVLIENRKKILFCPCQGHF